VDLVLAGLTAPSTDAEREASRRPPYPLPAALQGIRDALLRELESRLPPEGGDGPLTVTRTMAPPRDYRSTVQDLRLPHFEVADAACALVAVGALSDADVEKLVDDLPASCGIRRQQVFNHSLDGDITGAREAAEKMGESRWVGYQDIARVAADRGDADLFFAHWKDYEAGRHRQSMPELKERLVSAVARRDGWQAGLALTKDKRIGPSFGYWAFVPFLDGGDVPGLWNVLVGDAQGVLPELEELSLLTRSVVAASDPDPITDHPMLGAVVDRLIAVDPTVDKATMRWRDGLLSELWPGIGEKATLDRVRKAVRAPSLRRELTNLARDVRPRSAAPVDT